MVLKIFDNVKEIVYDDISLTISKGSKISIAAAYFSIYAYKELKKQLSQLMSFALFLPLQLLLKKKMKSKKESFIFLG